MESSSDKCVGTTTPSTQTSIHGAISGTPSFQKLLEERTLLTQTIVTHVRFHKSFYTILETNMPMFGSTSGGKSGAASALEKEDATALKGAKSKEDAEDVELHALIPIMMKARQGRRPPTKPVKPTYQRTLCTTISSRSPPHHRRWGRIAHPTRLCMDEDEDILQVIILNSMECLVFQGRHSRGEGFMYGEALALCDAYH